MCVDGYVTFGLKESIKIPDTIATRVKGGSRRESWGIEGHSENPVITRNKRYYLVERDPLRTRAVSSTQYAVLQISTIHNIPKNKN